MARVVERAGGEGEGVDITICAHDLEVQVDLVVRPGAEGHADSLQRALAEALPRALFADDERPVEELVLDLAREQGLSIAAAESCTGGLVAARLTSVPGSSESFAGGIVAYDNRLKRDLLGVSDELLSRHGAVSAETAAAMAQGIRGAVGADVGVSVTVWPGLAEARRRSRSVSCISTLRRQARRRRWSSISRETGPRYGGARPHRRSTC